MRDPTTRFTSQLPPDFEAYELVREDESANAIRLKQDLPFFKFHRGGLSASRPVNGSQTSDGGCVPSGTTGIVVNNSTRPFVVMWDHEHSAIAYLACLLETVPTANRLSDAFHNSPLDRESAADIIDLFATQLEACISAKPNPDGFYFSKTATSILGDASDGLNRNADIISVIFNIFEEELTQQPSVRGDFLSEILSACVRFFTAVVVIAPNRIWSLLASSKLLGLDGHSSRLVAFAAALEIPSGRFSLITSCLRLFERLVESVIVSLAASKKENKTLVKRFENAEENAAAAPHRVVGGILLAFTRIYLDVLQSSQQWSFADPITKCGIQATTINLFDRLLGYTYGYDPLKEPIHKLTGVFTASAELIEKVMLSEMRDSLANCLVSMLVPQPNTLIMQSFLTSEAESTLKAAVLGILLKLLVLSEAMDKLSSQLEQCLFGVLPVFPCSFATSPALQRPLVILLTALMRRAASHKEQNPPSILGNLSSKHAQDFLAMLRSFGDQLGDEELTQAIWEFMGTVVSKQQHWLAMVALNGDTPRNKLTKNKCAPKAWDDRSFLHIALVKASDINSESISSFLEPLQFIVLSQSSWPFVTNVIRKHEAFLSKISDWVDDLTDHLGKTELEQAERTYAAAIIAEICAIYLHNTSEEDRRINVRMLASKLTFLRGHGVEVPRYNVSLHTNLKRNFENIFPSCGLSAFQRSFGQPLFGPDYVYDTDFGRQVLERHSVWLGKRNQGFKDEFIRANMNLSVVEAQVRLLGGWKAFATQLSKELGGDQGLEKQMVNVVSRCLEANVHSNLTEAIFESLLQTRADLALTVLQRLIKIKSQVGSLKTLFPLAWDAVRRADRDLDTRFTSPDATYYRTLVQILLLTLQPYTWSRSSDDGDTINNHGGFLELPPETTANMLEIVVSNVIGKGFVSLTMQAYESPQQLDTSDYALVTGMLQTLLRVRGLVPVHSQIALRLLEQEVPRYAITLFSWSSQLLAANNDPVFGELSISFLREISSLQQMADNMAADGILAQLNTSNILNHLRNKPNGFGPLDSPPRVHVIWARGILPICLNLVTAVGEAFAAETLSFLNSFPNQLERIANAFDVKNAASPADPSGGTITLNAAAEVNALALLANILDTYRENPAAAATADGQVPDLSWDRNATREDIEAWLQGSRNALRNRIVPMSDKEAELLRTPALKKDGGSESRLEELVVHELMEALDSLNGSSRM